MTREELKEHCKKQVESCEMWAKAKGEEPSGKVYEEHKMILELLEQEPCDDAISRQAVLEYIEGSWAELGHSSENELVCQDIKEFPPVAPKSKTGHWIFKQFDEETGISNSYWCSKCGKPQGQVYKTYCASCGAKMIELQESGDKDE